MTLRTLLVLAAVLIASSSLGQAPDPGASHGHLPMFRVLVEPASAVEVEIEADGQLIRFDRDVVDPLVYGTGGRGFPEYTINYPIETAYRLRVRAVRGVFESAWTEWVTFEAPPRAASDLVYCDTEESDGIVTGLDLSRLIGLMGARCEAFRP